MSLCILISFNKGRFSKISGNFMKLLPVKSITSKLRKFLTDYGNSLIELLERIKVFSDLRFPIDSGINLS